MILENQNEELGSYIKQQGYYPLILKENEKEFYRDDKKCAIMQSVPKKAVDSGGN